MIRGCMSKGKYTFLFIFILICFVSGCSSSIRQETDNEQFYFQRGMNYMEKKDYVKAIADFQTVVESYQGSRIIDEVQYMLAQAHFMNEDYLTAAYEYERVYMDYPSSKYVPDARFKRALCYYNESPKADLDQDNTLLAMDDFNRFIDNYPRHEYVAEAQKYIDELRAKLAYKVYRAAELYRKLKKYDAALLYYRFVIQDYPRTIWANEARYGMGLIYLKQKNFEKAQEMFKFLINTNTRKDIQNRASEKLSDIEKRISRKKSN